MSDFVLCSGCEGCGHLGVVPCRFELGDGKGRRGGGWRRALGGRVRGGHVCQQERRRNAATLLDEGDQHQPAQPLSSSASSRSSSSPLTSSEIKDVLMKENAHRRIAVANAHLTGQRPSELKAHLEQLPLRPRSSPFQKSKQQQGLLPPTLPSSATPIPPSTSSRTHVSSPPPPPLPLSPSLSIQEQLYGKSTCFGCGHANKDGLQLKSMPPARSFGPSVATVNMDSVRRSNGMGMVNGGILASLLDCHTGAAIAWRGVELKEIKRGSGGEGEWARGGRGRKGGIGVQCGDCVDGSHGSNPPFLTSSLELKYRKPTPFDKDVQLVAEVVSMNEKVAVVKCKVMHEGEVTVTGVATWRRPSWNGWNKNKKKLEIIGAAM